MDSKCCCCRYCCNAVLTENEDIIYCEARSRTYGKEYAKRYKTCKDFIFNEIDVFNIEHTYKPKGPFKPKNFKGQISIFELEG